MAKKFAIITGTRAEYGYLKPLIQKILYHKKFQLSLFVTGMHLVKEYGTTINEIKNDGIEISNIIDMKIKPDSSNYDLAVSIAKGIEGFATVFKNNPPDMIIIFGDRIEPFAAAIAANSLNIPIAHIAGGEVGLGDIDDNLRHAITKLSHIHFTSTKKSRERVIQLGEHPWRVFKVGALSLDVIQNMSFIPKNQLLRKCNLPNNPIILVCFHPTTTEIKHIETQIKTLMESVIGFSLEHRFSIVIIYPNAYPGGFQIIKEINQYKKSYNNIFVFQNLPQTDYISFMKYSTVLIGNSSSGIIEAPSLGLPYICVGTRQKDREKSDNVIEVDYCKKQILEGLKKAVFNKEFITEVKKRRTPYGNGKATEKIVKVLDNLEINTKLLQKQFYFLNK